MPETVGLIISKNPSKWPNIYGGLYKANIIYDTANDIGEPGKDISSGYGVGQSW